MDFTPELSAFQGVIISADNVHSFSRLTVKGGNEDQIEYVVKNILKFLEQQNYIAQNAIVEEKIQKMRKFAFYIVLNADLPALEDLVENDGIDSVIWTIPTIPKCLMSHMLWNLHMDMFVYEAIAFAWPQLALEIAGALIDHFKYFTPAESLGKVRLVSAAIYRQICRQNIFSFENDSMSNVLTNALNNFQKSLNYFIEPPNSGKLANLKKDALYKFKGDGLETMLRLILECLNQFTSPQEFTPRNFYDMYLLTYKIGSYEETGNFVPCNNQDKTILECLDKCNELLLDKCKVLVMDVSVDVFCAWSEFEENGKSMQQTIGELCYKLRSKLLNINVISEHPIVNMIQQISRKPIEISDIVRTAENEVIIENIRKSGENRVEWIQALIHKENICQNITLVEEIGNNISVLSKSDCHTLYKICKNYLEGNTENIEHIKLLAIKAFRQCAIEVRNEILEEHFKDKCFTDSMETTKFNDLLTEIFNKVIADHDADLTDVLTVFLQNPQKVYTKIFNLSAESSQQVIIMLKVVLLLVMYTDHYYTKDTEPCIIRTAEDVLEQCIEKEALHQNLIKFFCGLKNVGIIPGSKLLLLIIMPKLHKALIDKDVRQIHLQFKLLCATFPLEELIPYRAPILAMVARLIDVVRWKITTYTADGPPTLELALQLQVNLFETYDGIVPVSEENWLKSKLRKLHPLNFYYYRKLWNPSGSNFVEILSGTPLRKNMDTAQLVAWLSQVLCSAIQTEWCDIWDSLTIFGDTEKLNLIHDALMTLTAAEAANRERNSFECLLHCYRCFVYIIRYKYFKEPLTDSQVLTVLQKIAATANMTQTDNTEQLAAIIVPLFAYLVQKKEDYFINVTSKLSELLRNTKFLEVVNKVFNNGTA